MYRFSLNRVKILGILWKFLFLMEIYIYLYYVIISMCEYENIWMW